MENKINPVKCEAEFFKEKLFHSVKLGKYKH